MARHEQLAKLAIDQVRALQERKQALEEVAEDLCNALAEYIGGPEGDFQYCKITPGRFPGEGPQPGAEWWRVAGLAFPGLMAGQGDGFYYFALRLSFTSGCYFNIPRPVFGIQQLGAKVKLRMPNLAERILDPSSESEVTEFCEAVFQMLLAEFSAPAELQRKEIGFHAIEHPQLIEKAGR